MSSDHRGASPSICSVLSEQVMNAIEAFTYVEAIGLIQVRHAKTQHELNMNSRDAGVAC